MFRYVRVKDGKKQLIWTSLLVFVVLVFILVIAALEAFWYGFTGGFSPLVGGFGLVAATLIVIRIVGASLASPVVKARSGLETS